MAKVILLLAMVTSNTVGCTLFVKALAGSGSSLPATVASSTVNYFCSVSEPRRVYNTPAYFFFFFFFRLIAAPYHRVLSLYLSIMELAYLKLVLLLLLLLLGGRLYRLERSSGW